MPDCESSFYSQDVFFCETNCIEQLFLLCCSTAFEMSCHINKYSYPQYTFQTAPLWNHPKNWNSAEESDAIAEVNKKISILAYHYQKHLIYTMMDTKSCLLVLTSKCFQQHLPLLYKYVSLSVKKFSQLQETFAVFHWQCCYFSTLWTFYSREKITSSKQWI